MDTGRLFTSQAKHEEAPIGSVPTGQSWLAAAGQGFAVSDFASDGQPAVQRPPPTRA